MLYSYMRGEAQSIAILAAVVLTGCDLFFGPEDKGSSPPPALAVVTTAAAELSAARANHTATRLQDGTVLVVGGWSATSVLSSAERYDPTADAWTAAGNLAAARNSHTATLLPDGRVLVAGGRDGAAVYATAELYDPATNTWSAAGDLADARALHTATLLPDGRVLVTGGFGLGNSVLASAELYDPATNSWTAAASLALARVYHSATLLPDGRVLVAAGAEGDPYATGWTPGATTFFSAELYDPNTDTWTAAGALTRARGGHTATLLSDGRVLIVGGAANHIVDTTDFYDPGSGTWTGGIYMNQSRGHHTTTLLPNGNVLVIGGQRDTHILGGYVSTAVIEYYVPASNVWVEAGEVAVSRYYHTATLLTDGRVLVVGGSRSSTIDVVATTELY